MSSRVNESKATREGGGADPARLGPARLWRTHDQASTPLFSRGYSGAGIFGCASIRTDKMVLEAAVDGGADALITCNVADFAAAGERFDSR